MTKTKTTKRALFASVFSFIVCVAMLIGSTFAWFTDTASTAVNSIQSGTLDIDLVDADGKSLVGETLNFIKAEDAGSEEILWEPGCTYNLPEVYVVNNGNLALKYKIVVSGINGDVKLNKAIEWTVKLADADIAEEYSLAAGETSGALTISGHMKKDAGNEYQGLSIDGIAITVSATQDTAEFDSYNNTYDKNAEYDNGIHVTPATAQNIINKAKDGDIIALAAGTYNEIVIDNEIDNFTIIGEEGTVVKGITVDTLTNASVTGKNFDGLTIKNIDFVDKGIVLDFSHGTPYAKISNVTIESCTFTGSDNSQNSIGNRLVDVGADSTNSNQLTNIVIKNCTITNAFQGIRLGSLYGNNVISGNTISNVNHNAITLRSVYSGTTLVTGNTISDSSDRAFRAAVIDTGATVTFENNVITNTGDADDGSNWKVNTNNGTVNFVGNTVDGAAWNG